MERPRRDPDDPPRQYRHEPREPQQERQQIEIAPATRFGTLSLQIQPGDAEILIDGERWTTTRGAGRVNIQLSPGRHQLEIRRDGFERYSEEIGIRENATFTLNVPDPGSIARYRVSFRAGTELVPHVDRRADARIAGALS